MIVYVSIGNSDDRLGQALWSQFYGQVDNLLQSGSLVRQHGRWLSTPDSRYQNACWCIEFDPDQQVVPWFGRPDMDLLAWLQLELSRLAGEYNQDSIAWAQAPITQFIKPGPVSPHSIRLEDPT